MEKYRKIFKALKIQEEIVILHEIQELLYYVPRMEYFPDWKRIIFIMQNIFKK